MTPLFLFAGLALAGPDAAAVDAVRPTLFTLAETPAADWAVARAEVLADVDEGTLAALADDTDWHVGLTAQALQAWRADPVKATETWEATPARRRDGAFVFRGEGTTAVIGERLQHRAESVAVRRALVDWLGRSTAVWPRWADSAYQSEADPQVRAAWIDLAEKAESPSRLDQGADGRNVVLMGFTDADARVRSASARVSGYLDAPRTLEALKVATTDASDEVAGLAARALGWRRASGAYETVAAVLDRADPRARLWAVRALQRLDAGKAAQDARLVDLRNDPDARVSRAATEVTATP